MIKKLTFIVFTLLLFTCTDKKYPVTTELNNGLVKETTFKYVNDGITQVINLAKKDSVQYSKIIEVHETTKRLLHFLEQYEETLVNITGGYNENGQYLNPNEKRIVRAYMIQRGAGLELKTKLDAYSKLLASYHQKDWRIAEDPKQSRWLFNQLNHQSLSFEQLHFANTKMIDCITILNNYRMKILLYESLTINLLLMDQK